MTPIVDEENVVKATPIDREFEQGFFSLRAKL